MGCDGPPGSGARSGGRFRSASFPWSACAAPMASASFYAPSRNQHVAGILDVSFSPAPFDAAGGRGAPSRSRGAFWNSSNVTGVLCVEFFLTRDGKLLVNELAPRPHNSGHLTIDACVTSQFEQQLRVGLRAAAGQHRNAPARRHGQSAGRLWAARADWAAAVSSGSEAAPLREARAAAGRKMGHFTATAATAAGSRDNWCAQARSRLTPAIL